MALLTDGINLQISGKSIQNFKLVIKQQYTQKAIQKNNINLKVLSDSKSKKTHAVRKTTVKEQQQNKAITTEENAKKKRQAMSAKETQRRC